MRTGNQLTPVMEQKMSHEWLKNAPRNGDGSYLDFNGLDAPSFLAGGSHYKEKIKNNRENLEVVISRVVLRPGHWY